MMKAYILWTDKNGCKMATYSDELSEVIQKAKEEYDLSDSLDRLFYQGEIVGYLVKSTNPVDIDFTKDRVRTLLHNKNITDDSIMEFIADIYYSNLQNSVQYPQLLAHEEVSIKYTTLWWLIEGIRLMYNKANIDKLRHLVNETINRGESVCLMRLIQEASK